ncbi:sensor histidine kinase [Chryseobacterium limigenitum]|uniref:Histidine kinase n=1 Tax=Chryseobacterium limigenitum TaxID=1612149 RepID=A0A1K2ISJ2_9FLAO|nr:histidine kinase [Chryseobacterium limigenitum]SFZ95278.1 Histidine kinase [Chryseobacterium limigenitum]
MFAVMTEANKTDEFSPLPRGCTCLGAVCESHLFSAHFLLNVLNHIGSELHGSSTAYRIIEDLGTSLRLIFNAVSCGGSSHGVHAFEDEMKLVRNTITIHKRMYLEDLELNISGEDCISDNLPIPLGLLQIPVENALLHGLRNKQKPPYRLDISFEKEQPENKEDEFCYMIKIEDNGVGRIPAPKNSSGSLIKSDSAKWGLKYLSSVAGHFEHIHFEITDKPNHGGTGIHWYIRQSSKNTKL